MFKNTFLSLSGHGYLHDVRYCQRDKGSVTLNLIHKLNESQSGDMWFECRFNKNQFPILAKLSHYLAKEKSVILKFDAQYSGFQQCYSEMSGSNPSIIIQLHGELLTIHEHYVEGDSTFCPNEYDIKNNRMLHRLRA